MFQRKSLLRLAAKSIRNQVEQSLTRVLKNRVSCIRVNRVLAGYVFVYVFSCIY